MNALPPPTIASALRDELCDLAHRVRRLAPSHRDPELFHIQKSEIAARLAALAGGAAPRPASVSAHVTPAQPRVVVRVVHVPMPRRYLRAPSRHRYPLPPGNAAQLQLTL